MKTLVRKDLCSFFIKQGESAYGLWYLFYENKDGKIELYSGPHGLEEAKLAIRLACMQHGHEIPEWALTKTQKLKNWLQRLIGD